MNGMDQTVETIFGPAGLLRPTIKETLMAVLGAVDHDRSEGAARTETLPKKVLEQRKKVSEYSPL